MHRIISTGIAAGLVTAAAIAPAQLSTTGAPPLLTEYNVLLERLQRNELERLKARMEIERLQAEMQRLDAQRSDATRQAKQLEEDLRRLSARLAAESVRSLPRGTPLMAMVDTSLRRAGAAAPPMRVEAMTIAFVGEPAVTGGWLRVTLGRDAYLADPADWATEEEILRRLQERQAFVREQIAMIPDVPDRPATDRLEQYELQFERLADTIGRVRAAFQRIHAAPRPAGVGTGEPPPSPR